MLKIKGLVILATALLSGCSTTFVEQLLPPQDYQSLYLRGVFNWWEADENYKVSQREQDVFVSSAKLIADGQPYDFKFADAQWQPGLSCGPIDEQVLTTSNKLEADCNNPQANFKFTPSETGVYEFYIDFSDADEPEVYVRKA